MKKTLKLYQAVNLGGEIGFLAKGDHPDIDETVLKHWLIKNMIKDGRAVVILLEDEPPNQPPGAGAGNGNGNDIENMTVEQLRDFAKGKGIEIPANTTKKDDIKAHILEKLKEANIPPQGD